MKHLLIALLLAQYPQGFTTIRDEGVNQGRAVEVNCTGTGVTCSQSGWVWTLNVAGASGTPVGFVRKTADESWSDGLVHNIADLTFPIGVNEVWMFDGWLDLDPGATAPQVSIGAGATGATARWEMSGWTAATQRNEVRDMTGFLTTPATGVANGRKWYPIRGYVTADGTHPYSVQLTIVSASGTFTVYKGSYIQFQRLL